MKNQEEIKSTETSSPRNDEPTGKSLGDRIAAGAWGLFFLWIGAAYLLKLDVSVGLLGVGVITLGGQFTRKYNGLKFEGFWLLIGILFFLGALWEIFKPGIPLVPILLIFAGLTLLLSSYMGKSKPKK